MRSSIIFAAIALSACTTTRIATPDPSLLTCAPATVPAIPKPYDWTRIIETARDVAEAVSMAKDMTIARDREQVEAFLAEREAGADCRAKVDGIREWARVAG